MVSWVFMNTPIAYTKSPTGKLMTTKELAVFLRVTPRTIGNLLKRKSIPVLKVGSVNRYQADRVVEALNKDL